MDLIEKANQFISGIIANNYRWNLNKNNKNVAQMASATFVLKCLYILKCEDQKLIDKVIGHMEKFYRKEKNHFQDISGYNNIVSENRQTLSAIQQFGKKYPIGIKLIKQMEENVLTMNNWKNPYSTGAHFSHVVFFYQYVNDKNKIKKLVKFLESIQKDDGWYIGNPNDSTKINGIMKVYTAMDVIGYQIKDKIKETIIEKYITSNKYNKNACGLYNYTYLLTHSSTPKYEDEIKKRLLEVKDEIMRNHYQKDGGFSFGTKPNRKKFYGVEVIDHPQGGDIHGTIIFLDALAMINNYCQLGMKLRKNLN